MHGCGTGLRIATPLCPLDVARKCKDLSACTSPASPQYSETSISRPLPPLVSALVSLASTLSPNLTVLFVGPQVAPDEDTLLQPDELPPTCLPRILSHKEVRFHSL